MKNLIKEKLWTFERFEMGHVFINPNHNQFLVNFYSFNIYEKMLFKMTYFHMDLKSSLTTM
jgi:hypothetical protein